jgi:alkanesulfonate monooxygenase SsuD/methylene tetrahydromethanopterin reductase-like flavin-dependent oxidoreductase (luciferase family)
VEIGIGLPNAVEGARGREVVEWGRRAEARGFASLGTIDRVRYGNYEPLTALAAAAAVTARIRLATTVLLAPLRTNPVELAKRALSLQALSDGRLTLGLGLGAREDDYEISDVPLRGRGRRFDAMLDRIREIWDGDEVGPFVAQAPRLILGGHADASFARVARVADGWIASGSGPDQFREGAEAAKAAWGEAGRQGKPRVMALGYFALGETAGEDARRSLGHYYAWLGEEVADAIVGATPTDPESVRGLVAAYEEAACDELVLFPGSSDPQQVDLLAEAVGL